MWNVTTFIRLYLESSALFSKGMIVQLVILFSLLVSGCSSPGLKPVTFSPEPVVRSNKSASIKFQTVWELVYMIHSLLAQIQTVLKVSLVDSQ